MGELRPVYCKFCRQTFLSDDLEKCSACGKVGGMTEPSEAASLRHLVEEKRPEIAPVPVTGEHPVVQVLHGYRMFKLIAAGIFLIGLGFFLILVPGLRDDPRKISAEDVVRGLCPMLIGGILLGLPLLVRWRGKSPRMKDEDRSPTVD